MTETRVKPVSRIGENAGEKLTAWNGIAKVRSITLTYVTWAIKALPRNVKASTSCEQKFFTRNSRSRKVSSWFCYHHAHAVWNSTPGARSMWQTSKYVANLYSEANRLMMLLDSPSLHGWTANGEPEWTDQCFPDDVRDLLLFPLEWWGRFWWG